MTDLGTLAISATVSLSVSLILSWLYLNYVRPRLAEKGVVVRV